MQEEVGITVDVVFDGVGDLLHAIKGGQHLRQARPGIRFTYHIAYGINVNPMQEEGRINTLIEQLFKFGLLSGDKAYFMQLRDMYLARLDTLLEGEEGYDDDVSYPILPDDIFFRIGEASNHIVNIYAYTQKNKKKHNAFFYKVIQHKASHWIIFSFMPDVFFSMNDADERRVEDEIYYDKSLAFLEHGSSVMHETEKKFVANMGFRARENGKKGIGIFLDGTKKCDPAARTYSLSQIQHPLFHALLQKTSPLPKSTAECIEDTIFIPCYFSNKAVGISFLLHAYAGVLGREDTRNVFLQGRLNATKYVLNEKNLSRLSALGFHKVIIRTRTQEITRVIREKGGKTLAILDGVYVDEDTMDLLKGLATVFMGCSGDNSLQDAISQGVIPLFIPHTSEKIDFMRDLKSMVETEMGQNPVVSNFLALYADLPIDNKNKPVLSKLLRTDAYHPNLLEDWKAVCRYLIVHYNAYHSLLDLFDAKIKVSLEEKNEDAISPSPPKRQKIADSLPLTFYGHGYYGGPPEVETCSMEVAEEEVDCFPEPVDPYLIYQDKALDAITAELQQEERAVACPF